jgi:hypothetical protein
VQNDLVDHNSIARRVIRALDKFFDGRLCMRIATAVARGLHAWDLTGMARRAEIVVMTMSSVLKPSAAAVRRIVFFFIRLFLNFRSVSRRFHRDKV